MADVSVCSFILSSVLILCMIQVYEKFTYIKARSGFIQKQKKQQMKALITELYTNMFVRNGVKGKSLVLSECSF